MTPCGSEPNWRDRRGNRARSSPSRTSVDCITGTRRQPEAAPLSNPTDPRHAKTPRRSCSILRYWNPSKRVSERHARLSQNHHDHHPPLQPRRMTFSGWTGGRIPSLQTGARVETTRGSEIRSPVRHRACAGGMRSIATRAGWTWTAPPKPRTHSAAGLSAIDGRYGEKRSGFTDDHTGVCRSPGWSCRGRRLIFQDQGLTSN
jgi:hypothetical protein